MAGTCANHDGFVKWLERVEGKIEKLSEAILGNGKPGLNERVRVLEEQRRRDAEEDARESRRRDLLDGKVEGRLMMVVRLVGSPIVAALVAAAAVALGMR